MEAANAALSRVVLLKFAVGKVNCIKVVATLLSKHATRTMVSAKTYNDCYFSRQGRGGHTQQDA